MIMRSDAVRGQLCEIAPAHNIRIPVDKRSSAFDRRSSCKNLPISEAPFTPDTQDVQDSFILP